jgi:hypothetical protein
MIFTINLAQPFLFPSPTIAASSKCRGNWRDTKRKRRFVPFKCQGYEVFSIDPTIDPP